MLRHISIFLIVLTLTLGLAANAAAYPKNVIKAGTSTLDGLNISAIDGTAFVNGTDFSAFTGQWIEIVAGGYHVGGFIKASITSEVLGAAKTVTGITKANPGVITFSAGHGLSEGMLVKFSGLTEMTELNGKYRVLTNVSGDTFQIGDTSSFGAAETTGGACAQQVTAPGAGVTITTTAFGSTYNWYFKEASFPYNNTAGFTWTIYPSTSFGQVIASGSIAAGSAKIDTTSTNAFADGGATPNLAQWAGLDTGVPGATKFYIVFQDSAYKTAGAYVGAAGSGPTTSSVTVNNSDFTSDEPPGTAWTRDAGWTVSGGVGVASSAGAGISIYQSVLSSPNGKLYSASWDLVSRTAGSFVFRLGGQTQSYVSTPATYTYYITPIASTATVVIYAGGAGTSGTIDNIVINQITEPASTGVHLLSTCDGTTRAFAYNDGINPNLALTYKVYKVMPKPGELLKTATIDSGDITGIVTTPGSAKVNLGAAAAIIAYAGNDTGLTSYIIVLQDTNGKCAYGHMGGVVDTDGVYIHSTKNGMDKTFTQIDAGYDSGTNQILRIYRSY